MSASPVRPDALGSVRSVFSTDASVARHRVHVVMGLAIAALIFAGFTLFGTVQFRSFALLFVGLGLSSVLALIVVNFSPSGKQGGMGWTRHAFAHPYRSLEIRTDGFVVRDGDDENAYRWNEVRYLRHPNFPESTWTQTGMHPFFTQRTKALLIGLPGDEVLNLTDHLKDIEELTVLVQDEVYARLHDVHTRLFGAGELIFLGPLSVDRSGLRAGVVRRTWDEINSLELKNGRLLLVDAETGRQILDLPALEIENFPLFLALLEREVPSLARGVRAGLPIDAAAELWRRAARLRDETPDVALPEPGVDETPDHGGRLLPRGVDFFVPAPEALGPLVSAYSSLRTSDEPKALDARLLIVMIVSGVAAGVGLAIIYLAGVVSVPWLLIWGILPTAAGALIAWFATAFAHTCTYVGTRGVARFRCKGRREILVEETVVLFADVVALRRSLTVRRKNGQYQGTDYEFVWTDATGEARLTVKGSYTSEKEPPPSTDDYHFGESGEVAWSLSFLAEAARRVEERGHVDFPMKNADIVRAGPGYLEFHLKGVVTHVAAADLDEVVALENRVRFKRVDAQEGWFRKKGIYDLPASEVANLKVLMFLLRTLVAFGALPPNRTADADRLNRLQDALARSPGVGDPWHGDARAAAFIRQALPDDAAARALDRIRRPETR